MSVGFVEDLEPRERLEAEAHTARCAPCADTLRDLGATAVALDRAYAPLRARSVALSPARVRLAVRAPRRPSWVVRYARLTARANELAVAAAVMVFAVIGSMPVPPAETETDRELAAQVRLMITKGYVADPVREEPYVAQRIGRLLLHEALLDPRIVPIGDGSTFLPQPALPGKPY